MGYEIVFILLLLLAALASMVMCAVCIIAQRNGAGDKIEAVYMIPGWTHNIINLSDTDDLVTVMTCNEGFDPNRPDTFFEKVKD